MKKKITSKITNGITNEQQTNNKQITTNKNDKNDKNEEEVEEVKEEIEQQLQKQFINCTGSTNTYSIEECISYLDDLPYEVIEKALIKTSGANGNWNYAKKILQEWLKKGIKTIEQVEAEERNFKQRDKPKDGGLEEWIREKEEQERNAV